MNRIDRLVRGVLAGGLGISATLLIAGLIVWAVRGGSLPAAVSLPPASLADLIHGRPIGFFSFGLFMLVLTPFARVAGSVVVFALQRDRRYATITATVLLVMVASLLLGRI